MFAAFNLLHEMISCNLYHKKKAFNLQDVTPKQCLAHAREELAELADAPGDMNELGDLFGCLLEYAARSGWDLELVEQAIVAKWAERFAHDKLPGNFFSLERLRATTYRPMCWQFSGLNKWNHVTKGATVTLDDVVSTPGRESAPLRAESISLETEIPQEAGRQGQIKLAIEAQAEENRKRVIELMSMAGGRFEDALKDKHTPWPLLLVFTTGPAGGNLLVTVYLCQNKQELLRATVAVVRKRLDKNFWNNIVAANAREALHCMATDVSACHSFLFSRRHIVGDGYTIQMPESP